MTREEFGRLLGIEVDLIPPGRPNRPGHAIRPAFITIHNTSNRGRGADARAHARFVSQTGFYTLPSGRKNFVSWHYTVDDGCIIKHLPVNERAFHAGTNANGSSIGIEICMNQGIDQAKADLRAARLVAALMFDLGIGLDKLRTHLQWTGKKCPETLLDSGAVGGRWTAFRDKVASELATIDRDESEFVSPADPELRDIPLEAPAEVLPDTDDPESDVGHPPELPPEHLSVPERGGEDRG